MADGLIQIAPDGAGKKLDTETLTVSGQTVHRERHQWTGVNDTDIAAVTDSDPSTTGHGGVVRPLNVVAPQYTHITSVALADGALVDLDSATIPAAKTGKLLTVEFSSSVPCRWEIKSRDGAVLLTFGVMFTSWLRLSDRWTPPDKRMNVLLGNGIDENFRVTAKNNSGSGQAADVYATLYWDEV